MTLPSVAMDNVTTSGHHMTMKKVKIAELKSQLSRHLRAVQAGETVTVLDRETPIARIVPVDAGEDVTITPAAPGAPRLGALKLPRPPRLSVDVVDLLLADRRSRG
jgi:antitoxin (DNA-binding transcriptional repressor) of toxin-antitoxin stability system